MATAPLPDWSRAGAAEPSRARGADAVAGRRATAARFADRRRRPPTAVPARPAGPSPAAACCPSWHRERAAGGGRPAAAGARARPDAGAARRAGAERAGAAGDRPEFAAVFGPGSRAEQPICGMIGGRPLRGPDRPAGGHRGRGAGRRPQEQPHAAGRRSRRARSPICASSPPTGRCWRRSIPAAGPRGPALDRGAAARRDSGALLDRHAPGPQAPLDAAGWRNLLSDGTRRHVHSLGTASESVHGREPDLRHRLRAGRAEVEHARAGRFLGRVVRPVQDDRPAPRGAGRRARRQGRR